MTANKAKFALTLGLALVLAACGGGGGGGGGDDDDDGGNSSGPPPSGFGQFDGSFSVYAPNSVPQAPQTPETNFDDTLTATFVDGKGTVGTIATEFDYPVANGAGCYYSGDAIQHCVERAQGNLIALCTSGDASLLAAVGISNEPTGTFTEVDLDALAIAAAGKPQNAGLVLNALNCSNTLNDRDSVTVLSDKRLIQRFNSQQGTLTPTLADQLFSAGGLGENGTRLGSKAYRYTQGTTTTTTTYYVVNFGASSSGSIEPKLFVSTN
ncbi:MAG: hypothetical protein H0W40_02950 [Methylibium sp.]|uniref:hypothetical protein n=1 Tax=Methylibium sp. TaxID=2067992 RepID=UPI0018555C66|nr:hypothetical protein [Methylibium sp.]MBA3596320.1 hypothetical protein [Methylibium sp.]